MALAASFPAAGLLAMLFRFPIPFSGYATGISAVIPAMIAVIFYGICGGIVVQAVMGLVAGIWSWRCFRPDQARVNRAVLVVGGLAAFPGLMLLAILDWVIGPW